MIFSPLTQSPLPLYPQNSLLPFLMICIIRFSSIILFLIEGFLSIEEKIPSNIGVLSRRGVSGIHLNGAQVRQLQDRFAPAV